MWRVAYPSKRVLTCRPGDRVRLRMGLAKAASPGDVEGVFVEECGVAGAGPVVTGNRGRF